MLVRSQKSIRSLLAAMAAMILLSSSALLAEESATGRLTEKSLGNMIKGMGIQAKKEKQRYDFNFKNVYEGEEWNLTMSAVLSKNGKTIWVMAWLDELPRSAANVPRTALLRLLSQNDRMGKGKSFAYIASNRRFVLQMVIPNEKMSTKKFHATLTDLGSSVVESYPYWHVDNWKRKSSKVAKQPKGSSSRTAVNPRGTSRKGASRRAIITPRTTRKN